MKIELDLEIRSNTTLTAAVLADTHIPDRVKTLHVQLVPQLKNLALDLIFHAGDISRPGVLEQLNRIAPTYAVRGNRDILFIHSLPVYRRFNINGARFFMTHGHLDLYHYWRDKNENILHGYQFDRYHKRLLPAAHDADVILFGHSHHAENRRLDQRLYFNPGSSSVAEKPDFRLSFGIMQISPQGDVKAEIISLAGD